MAVHETLDAYSERFRANFVRMRNEVVWGPEGLYGARRVKAIPYLCPAELLRALRELDREIGGTVD